MLITFADVAPCAPIELTRDEMLAISTEISSRFAPQQPALPPAAERHALAGFSRQELQAIDQDISRRFAPKIAGSKPEILLLPVDPHHLYAFWDAGPSPAAGQPPARPLMLRIYWQPDAAKQPPYSNIWFDVPADAETKRKKIRLPIDDTGYSASLGRLNPDRSLEVLAQSNRVHVPAAPGKKHLAETQAASTPTHQDPGLAVHRLQGILDATRQQNTRFAESWAIKLHPQHTATPTRDPVQLYVELMSILKTYRIDAELIPTTAPMADADNPSYYASGLGCLLDE